MIVRKDFNGLTDGALAVETVGSASQVAKLRLDKH